MKSIDKAIEIQTGFAKQAYDGFIVQSTKVGELYTNLIKEATKPIQKLFVKTETAATTAQPVVTKSKAA